MIVAIASTNPVKVNAVKKVFQRVYPKAKYLSFKVDSRVGKQPVTDRQTRLGAVNRARAALKQAQADIAVGIEGGVTTIDGKMYCTAWCAIIDSKRVLSLGGGMHFLIPKKLAVKIKAGGEVGPEMDKILGTKNIKRKGGIIDFLTGGLTSRTLSYQKLVEYALSSFAAPNSIVDS
ncbi:MAG: hypothetical protein UX85_C0001G0254 [Candidatus Beckwithbacteria bacterium GW2011_GWB1_47_15]|uniref:inosine/xanthosine triphosphatase n=1 Tax=Candidatus Beckwithbacteria bacterium GW2011_GWB1_47_15 TaxID=1618371 RepID=A0A0G1UWF5_9BACT|nr:MAG: NTPase [Candidatus Beckwithbacteria bacterium GW2011_GWC1_49_16]AQS30892.1 hypothetical protein [uncultured bacterium]KKU36076.1 MAG: hypothetical protein UX50_C0001G0253 [Candidatus Beckwithbacteria bacterium GW2011_GWA1_46_30]KKU62040.1 MAG: hypothetical protein UX85_C0001G0254 [Candidatus Beckwithbacteria bacterium GW2011_GWB1_47_15]KKU72407.1 MAG: hypothetical protein UX97_C0001G0277 [Candidatus Beckwithbacteria bacterium GW2011_GWA2_47_25]OGD49314.1 MAG: hypothetical protein A2877